MNFKDFHASHQGESNLESKGGEGVSFLELQGDQPQLSDNLYIELKLYLICQTKSFAIQLIIWTFSHIL